MSEIVYLVTSDDRDRPETLFQGYCFHGSHLVYGDAGARAFARATGERIGGGEDGCYVSMRSEGEDVVLHNDAAGHKKVFYVEGDGHWAASNSVYRLVEHLRRHGRPVQPNYAQLATLRGRGSGHSQISSFATPAQGIMLAPMGAALRIGPGGARLERAERDGRDGRRPESYAEALEVFVEVWTSRLMTLLAHERMTLLADLTGGLDSRTTMTLVEAAVGRLGGRGRAGEDGGPRRQYRCGSIKDDPLDLEVARALAARFDLPLNEGGHRPLGGPMDRFEGWRDLCLGVYHSIYFPRVGPHPLDVRLGGGGGANHRPYYARHGERQGDLAGFVETYARQIEPEALRPEFERDVMDAIGRIEALGGEGDPLILHYRHFRSRFHAGRSPQYSVTFAPLASRHLDDCAALAGSDRVTRGQVFYDVMASILPEVLDIPFDKEAKNPDDLVRSTLTRVEAPRDPRPGRVFADEPGGEAAGRPPAENPFTRLRSEFEEARRLPFVEAFCGAEALARADETIRRAEAEGRFFHASNGKPLALALTCAMVRP